MNRRRSAVFPVKESEDESDDFVVIEAIEPVELSLGNKVETTKYDILPLPQDLLEGKLVFSFISILTLIFHYQKNVEGFNGNWRSV